MRRSPAAAIGVLTRQRRGNEGPVRKLVRTSSEVPGDAERDALLVGVLVHHFGSQLTDRVLQDASGPKVQRVGHFGGVSVDSTAGSRVSAAGLSSTSTGPRHDSRGGQ